MDYPHFLTQLECINALAAGYILKESNNSNTVCFYKGKQQRTNKRRGDYKFDNNRTWFIVGRLPLWKRIYSQFF